MRIDTKAQPAKSWEEWVTGKPDVIVVNKGGQGSGNFGHAGRPGEVGGSGPGGGGETKPFRGGQRFYIDQNRDVIGEWVYLAQKAMNSIPTEFQIVPEQEFKIFASPQFATTLGGWQTALLGEFRFDSGNIRLYPYTVNRIGLPSPQSPEDFRDTTIHEYGHAVDHYIGKKLDVGGPEDLGYIKTFSDTQAFQTAWIKDKDNWTHYGSRDNLGYYMGNSHEAFAAAFSAMVGSTRPGVNENTFKHSIEQIKSVIQTGKPASPKPRSYTGYPK